MALAGQLPSSINDFLTVKTPQAWVVEACRRIPELLLDHANCELKAASTALSTIYRYSHIDELVHQMSRLAREELRHFEQVRKIMRARSIPFKRLSASRYAGRLHDSVRSAEPGRLVDSLIIGALIEARSCERFAALLPNLPEDLQQFYAGLLASEARHFEHYLQFARSQSGDTQTEFEVRLTELTHCEANLISETDDDFRFHSGVPR